jgi:DNA-binding response OmpR family regulator
MRILLIEDHPDTLTTLRRLLAQQGVVVDSATTAREAQRLLESAGPYDVIVFDIGLPDGDGLDVIRQAKLTPRPRLIALTAWAAPEDRRRSRSLGLHAYLTKPIGMRELLSAIFGAEQGPRFESTGPETRPRQDVWI